jgi:capsular exopolysaccharide synthesis family protein
MTSQIPNASPEFDKDPRLPVVPTAAPPGGSLGMPLPPPAWMDVDRKKDGFNVAAFIHSLRRRWIVGLGLGFLLASLVAGLFSILVPTNSEAMVLIRVRPTEDEGIGKVKGRMTTQEFELFKKTQADLLKSTFVINAALRQPGISQLRIVRQKPWGIPRPEEEIVGWLEGTLRVSSPEGTEMVVLSMKDRNADELVKLLNAVTDAYIKEIVSAEDTRQTTKLDRLREKDRRNSEEMMEKLTEMKQLSETFGSTEVEQNKLQIDLVFQRLRAIEQEKFAVEQQLRQIQDEFFMKQQLYQASLGFQPRDWEIDQALQEVDPEYVALASQLAEIKVRSSLSSGQLGVGSGAAVQTQTSALQQQMARIKSQKKKEIVERLKMVKGNDQQELQKEMGLLQGALQVYQQRLLRINDRFKEEADKLASMGQSNERMELLEMELISLQKVSDELKQSIESLEIDMEANRQIQVLQRAHIPSGAGWLVKYMQIGGSWMLTLLGTLLGIAYWDYQSKRVNSTKDVMDEGELRVIGSLPMLNGRRAGGLLSMSPRARQLVEIGLSRAIDSIRTALAFRKANKPLEVLLVTSALGQEGKTTVASQLAVSFARSGRRTLLIDGDVRNPQQHIVLGLPFNAGLCEYLRDQAQLEDVVRATAAESLWFMTAGYRDSQTDQCLASPAVRKLIDELRSRFDLIVLDTGPVLTSPDAMLLGQHADVAVISVRRDISRLPKVVEAADRLRSVGVEIAGAVVNGMAMDIREGELQAPHQVGKEPQLQQVG